MRILLFASAVLFAVSLNAQSADAARIQYNLGGFAITKVADLPEEETFKIEGTYVDLGWLHKEYSVFGGAFWVFDEQGYVLYAESAGETSYVAVPEDMLAAISEVTGRKYPAAYPMSFWQRWAGLVIFSCLMTIGVFRKLRKRRAALRAEAPA